MTIRRTQFVINNIRDIVAELHLAKSEQELDALLAEIKSAFAILKRLL
jgi:hypothetical protein